MIPGINLLDIASTVINLSTVQYYQFLTRTLNNDGDYVNTFASPIALQGSLQPLPRSKYQEMGFDLAKIYYSFFASKDIQVLQRNIAGDQLTFDGATYQCESSTDWFLFDKWTEIYCIQITPTIT